MSAMLVQMSAMLDQLESGITREVHAAVTGALATLAIPTRQLLALTGTPSAASPNLPPAAASPSALKAHIAALAAGCKGVASDIILACDWVSATAHSQQHSAWELEQTTERLHEEVLC